EIAARRAEAARDAALDRADAARDAALDRADAAREAALERAQAIAEEARENARQYGRKDYAMRAVGVTPTYVQELASAGLPGLTPDQLIEARAIGLNGGYVRALVAAGARPEIEGLVQFRALGITPAQVAQARRDGAVSNDQIVSKVMGGMRSRFKGWPFSGARPSNFRAHTGRPAASPPNWDPPDRDNPDSG